MLRGYVDRGELAVFKGAKHVYVDPADLPEVNEIDLQHLAAELESAVLQSLRWRLIQILAGRDWRAMRPHRITQREDRHAIKRIRRHTPMKHHQPTSTANTLIDIDPDIVGLETGLNAPGIWIR